MKQVNDQPPNAAATNDAVIKYALKTGNMIFVCVHKETKVVITNMGPRPVLYTGDSAADSRFNDGKHKFVDVNPRDPFADCFMEETPQGNDRWMYHPMVVVHNTNPPPAAQSMAGVASKVTKVEVLPSPLVVETSLEDMVLTSEEAAEHGLPYIDAAMGRDEETAAAEELCPVHGTEYNGYGFCTKCEEPLPGATHGKPRIIARHSELVDAASCLHAYNLKWIKNLRPVRTDVKLTTGTLFHAFQEVYEADMATLEAGMAVLALESGLLALDLKGAEFHNAIPEADPQARMDFLEKSWRFAKDICTNYHAWRTTDPVGMGLSAILQPEATFTINLGEMDGVDVYLSGTMDGIGVTRVTFNDAAVGGPDVEQFWLREYKTCASIPDKLKQYRNDKQTRRYVAALRHQGVHVMGVELVLAAKTLPLSDEDFVLKDGSISADKSKWAKANYAQALRIPEIGKLAAPDAKKGLTEKGFHDILKTLEDKPNPFFHVERLYFNDHELNEIMEETLIEGHRLHVTRETASRVGDRVFTRNPGQMGFNCKCCSVRDLCEMGLKGVDTAFHISENYTVDGSIHSGKEIDDADD